MRLAGKLAPGEWHRLSAGDGMKGQRLYDWARCRFGAPAEQGLTKWLLLRRSVEKPEELAYYLCLAPADTSLKELARAAGQRWSIECCFEAAKQETDLDEYEVRSWHGWYRHITLSMLALVFLSVVRGETSSRKKKSENLVPLTEPEIRRLLFSIVWPQTTSAEKILLWSYWRRQHQAIAKRCHYKKRGKLNLLL